MPREYVLGTNDLRESVRSQGVLLPVTLVPITFAFTDGSKPVTGLCTIDGSSRMTAAMDVWGLDSEQVLFDLSTDSALAARRSTITDLMESDVATLSADQLASLRTQSIPANLIVGYEAFEDGLDYTALLDAYLGLLHVEPPKSLGRRCRAGQESRFRIGRTRATRTHYTAAPGVPGWHVDARSS